MSTSLSGKVALITGANTGIGRVTAVELARRGAHVVLACRSEDNTAAVVTEIEAAGHGSAEFIKLDLASLQSVRDAAAAFLKTERPLHLLINNAGLAGQQGLTQDGFELAFGVNHLGHFLLTELLIDKLKEAAPARVVIVASKAHYTAKGIDFVQLRKPTATATGLAEYQVSKLANVLHAKELAARLKGSGVTSYSLHPGVVASDVWRVVPWPLRTIIKWFMISTEEGAQTTLHCATDPKLADESGRYYDSCKPKKPSALYEDAALVAELHARSVEWTSV